MKEQLYTIPLNDAFHANDECPFCFIERNVEQDLLDFVLGSGASYMESDVRADTDRAGFCRTHFKKMFDYGNTLGNGWILKTHYMQMRRELEQQTKGFTPGKTSLVNKIKKPSAAGNSVSEWVQKRERSCYICNRFAEMYTRYLDTFFHMYRHDPDFKAMFEKSKGFCLTHFGDLCAAADQTLSDKEKAGFFPVLFSLMNKNMERLQEDINWLIEKFDYLHKDDDWKDSKDAVQRCMQKLKGGYPADAVYRQAK